MNIRSGSLRRALSVAALAAPTLLLGALGAVAQPRTGEGYVVSQWSVDEGLPVNSVIDFARGPDGFLWMATFDGLVRFDGSRFSVFSAASVPEIPSNRFLVIFSGARDDLWSVTEQGAVVRYRDGRFTHIDDRYGLTGRYTVIDRLGSSEIIAIATTDGVGLYRSETDSISMTTGLGFEPLAVDVQDDGSYWVGGAHGHLAFVDAKGTVHHVGPEGLLQDDVDTIHEDRQGNLWVLTLRSLLRRTASGFVAVRDADGAIWHPGVDAYMAEDPSGRLWMVDRPGLAMVTDDELVPVEASTITPEAVAPEELRGTNGHLWTNGVTTLYRDGRLVLDTDGAHINMLLHEPDGSVWVATNRRGLMQIRPTPIRTYGLEAGLPGVNIYPVLADVHGNVWIGTPDVGLGCYGDACPDVSTPTSGIFSFHEEADGTLWAGGYGLYRLEEDRFVPVPVPFTDRIRAIHRDRNGSLWVGSEEGLAEGRQRPDGSWNFRPYTTENGLTHDWVRLLTETRDGTLWAGTSGGGLMRVRRSSTPNGALEFDAFTEEEGLCSNNVRHLYEDGDGILWIATEDRGLCRVQLPVGAAISEARVSFVQSRDGLFDDALHHVVEDDYDRLWMSSNRGLFWVPRSALNDFADGGAQRVFSTIYTERDGLRHREFNGGVQPAGARDASGRLWFPTQHGLVSLDPADVVPPAAPRAVVEGIRVGNEIVAAGRAVTLGPDDRDVRIEYGAAYFGHPTEMSFRYRLSPYDTEWRHTANERYAAYTNLEPGEYTFEVAAGAGGRWQSAPAALSITRQPHFYETRWFVAFLLLGALLVGFTVHAARLKNLHQRRDQLEREVAAATEELTDRNEQLSTQNEQLRRQESLLAEQARQLTEMDQVKTQFFANTSHELRTPLTLMLEPVRELRDDRALALPDPVRETLELVYRNGLRLRRLINQMLDLSRLEAGGVKLDRRKEDLVLLLRRQVASFASSARVNGLTLRFESERETLPCVFDAEAMEKVVSNLLSNAIKFTPAGGRIEAFVGSNADGDAVIRVSDTGPGIPADKLERIFERFFQVDSTSTRHYEGSGIGLALTREFVAMHGGTVRAESPPGRGAVLTVTLPNADLSTAGDSAPREVTYDVVSAPVDQQGASSDDVDARALANEETDETLVLVVEDNPDMRSYLAASLESIGRTVLANDGDEGIDRAFAEIPDLIVSDVMMPGSDGFELCSRLKADRRTSHIPILLLTARADAESRVKGYDLGADAYLAKPFGKPELVARSRGLLENRRRLREHLREASQLTLSDVDLPSQDARFLEDVSAALEENLSDVDFGVERLAEAVAMSKRQLLRKLSGLTGESPSEMLRRLRMERAGSMLRQNAGSVKEIAYAVGYRSTSSFRQAFKEHFGQSPSEYAEQ